MLSYGLNAITLLQAELATRAGRISELEHGAVSREQFEELQKELQDQRLETRLAHTRCEELQQHCEELVRNSLVYLHAHMISVFQWKSRFPAASQVL